MEVSGQIHVQASVPQGGAQAHIKYWQVRTRSRSGSFVQKKMDFPCRDMNLGMSGPWLVSIPTELHRFPELKSNFFMYTPHVSFRLYTLIE
jgi:hypothetical protein